MDSVSDVDERSLVFGDYIAPAISGGLYTVKVEQEVFRDTLSIEDPVSSPADFPPITQEFEVRAPRFSLDPGYVHAVHPPQGSVGSYDSHLCHMSFTRAVLPWEENLGTRDKPVPFVALMVFREGELPLDPYAQGHTVARTVDELLTATDVLVPQLGSSVIPDVRKSQCQTLDVPKDLFFALAPKWEELAYLSHVRRVDVQQARRNSVLDMTTDEPGLYGVTVGNRFSREPGNYTAHLLSMEGFEEYLRSGAPEPSQIPQSTVRLASLYSWSYTSDPEGKGHFSKIVSELAAPGWTDSDALALRLQAPSRSGSSPAEQEALDRLWSGYAPIPYVTASGERTPAWYRGPFSPVVAAPVPGLHPDAENNEQIHSADGLMVYARDWGIFDISYASAWSLGRMLAMSHSKSRTTVSNVMRQVRTTALRVMSLLASNPAVRGLNAQELEISEQLLSRHHSVGAFHDVLRDSGYRGGGPATQEKQEPKAQESGLPRHLHLRSMLERPGIKEAVSSALSEEAGPFGDLQEALQSLESVPFDYLVPDARMLPSESIRFFYIDKYWVSALTAGSLSTGLNTSLDKSLIPCLQSALEMRRDTLDGSTRAPEAGLLIRSRLVRDWPGTTFLATSTSGDEVELVRHEYLAPDLLLLLFAEIPDSVVIKEPHQDLYMGVTRTKDSADIELRYADANNGHVPGKPIGPDATLDANLYLRTDSTEVLSIKALTDVLHQKSSQIGSDISPAVLALQLIVSPCEQVFNHPASKSQTSDSR